MSPTVRETAQGWEVVAGDRVLGAHASLTVALDMVLRALLADSARKRPILCDVATHEPNGAWRWLPASAEERAQDWPDGGWIDRTSLVEAAESLNVAVNPIPIDGGPTPPGMLPSAVHGSELSGGGVPANGWAHYAVVCDTRSGAELYVWAELVPAVAAEVDAGRLAFGSVAFAFTGLTDEGAMRGVEYVSHALTNRPAVQTMTPSTSVRGNDNQRVTVRSVRARLTTTRSSMPIETEIKPAEEQPTEKRAEVPDEQIAELAAALGLPEGSDFAACLAAVQALMAEDQAEEAESPPADPMMAGEAQRAARETEASLATLRSAHAQLEAEVVALRERERAREDAAWLDGECAKRKLSLRAEDRETLTRILKDDAKNGRAAVEVALRGVHVPPGATVTPPPPASSTAGDPKIESTPASDAEAEIRAAKALAPSLRAEFPTEPDHLLFARALKRVRKG